MGTKFDIEKFDGRINFGLWQVQVKDVLIQFGASSVGSSKEDVANVISLGVRDDISL